jgi:hypothetical protein
MNPRKRREQQSEEPPAQKRKKSGIFTFARFSNPIFQDLPEEVVEGVSAAFSDAYCIYQAPSHLGEQGYCVVGEEPSAGHSGEEGRASWWFYRLYHPNHWGPI